MTPDPRPVVRVLPGNGHVEERLDAARAAAAALPRPFRIESVHYETSVRTFDALLDGVEADLADADLVYATGIGGLVHLALLARGTTRRRAIWQGPVLWGLESRRFPKIMRLPLMPRALTLALKTGPIRRRFERKHFLRPLDPALRSAFFDGYADARAFARWFGWLTPSLLRDLEPRLRGRQDLVDTVRVWWGSEDHVVTTEELRITERALGLDFDLEVKEGWAHYPMIDDPSAWVRDVAAVLDAQEESGAVATAP